ncbi:hypothetical protein ACFCYX_04775 [Streptomyces populi]|uniref:hypothetical protein n=1 Tax=Streptomyces populi TaxID=2058924 RepID=UPI0035E33572
MNRHLTLEKNMRLRATLLAVATAGATFAVPAAAHAAAVPKQTLRLTAGAESAPGVWTSLRMDIGAHTSGKAYLDLSDSKGLREVVFQRYDSKTKKWSTLPEDSYGNTSIATVASTKAASVSLRFRPAPRDFWSVTPGAAVKSTVGASHFVGGRAINHASATTLVRTVTTKLTGVANSSTKRGVLHPFTLTTKNTTKRNLGAVGQDLQIAGSSKTKAASAKDFQLQQWKTDSQGHGSWKNLTLVNKGGRAVATGISPATKALAPGKTVTYKFRLAVRTTAVSGLNQVGLIVDTREGSQVIATSLADYWGSPNWD